MPSPSFAPFRLFRTGLLLPTALENDDQIDLKKTAPMGYITEIRNTCLIVEAISPKRSCHWIKTISHRNLQKTNK